MPGEHVVDRRRLPGEADAPPHLVGLSDDIVPGDDGGARIGSDERRQDADRRGLAGPVGAEEREHLAALDPQVEPLEHRAALVALRHPRQDDHRAVIDLGHGGLLGTVYAIHCL